MMQLYKNIRKYRLIRKMSQSELAEKMGYADKGMISRVENGQIDLPISRVVEFSEVLKVSPGELMGWNESKLPEVVSIRPLDEALDRIVENSKKKDSKRELLLKAYDLAAPSVQDSIVEVAKALLPKKEGKEPKVEIIVNKYEG